MMDIFKAYDIRGIYGSEITTDTAHIIAKAFAKIIPKGPIVIAYDGRNGSQELAAEFKAMISRLGYFVHEVGMSSTPMFYFLVNDLHTNGGVMITASHNPPAYNGFKIVGKNGVPISGLSIKQAIA